jgi:hypothetical protein
LICKFPALLILIDLNNNFLVVVIANASMLLYSFSAFFFPFTKTSCVASSASSVLISNRFANRKVFLEGINYLYKIILVHKIIFMEQLYKEDESELFFYKKKKKKIKLKVLFLRSLKKYPSI